MTEAEAENVIIENFLKVNILLSEQGNEKICQVVFYPCFNCQKITASFRGKYRNHMLY